MFRFFKKTPRITHSSLVLMVKKIPYSSLNMSYGLNQDRNLHAFYSILTGLGYANESDFSSCFNRDTFKAGYALYCFDIYQSSDDSIALPLLKSGNVKIEGRFSTAPEAALNLICFTESPGSIEITQSRQVNIDY